MKKLVLIIFLLTSSCAPYFINSGSSLYTVKTNGNLVLVSHKKELRHDYLKYEYVLTFYSSRRINGELVRYQSKLIFVSNVDWEVGSYLRIVEYKTH